MALGHLKIDPWEWPRWTLKEFNTAYEGWTQVNINEPWERTRAMAYYSVVTQVKSGTVKTWEDLFPLSSDKFKKKRKLKANAIIRDMTEQEKEEFKEIIKNSIPING